MNWKCKLGLHCNHETGRSSITKLTDNHGKFNFIYTQGWYFFQCCRCNKKSKVPQIW
jgi:hypothetical protein